MKTLVLTTALAFGFVVPVLSPAVAGDQVALSLGVEPGQYSQAELARLKGAKDAGEWDQVAALKAMFDSDVVSTQSVDDQIARNLGVEPGQYSQAELARIKGAKDAGEHDQVAALKSMFDGDTVSTQSAGVTQGQRQMAARAGIDPETHTLKQTVDAWLGTLSDG